MNYTALCKYYRAYTESTREGKYHKGNFTTKVVDWLTVNAVRSAPHRFIRAIFISIYRYNRIESFKRYIDVGDGC